ncbi:hypothetical protein GOP47_0013762 [Adiantum capillus-veneris]|uniref:Uncharacterized protein n=1 Tax=Adiantum capillus-veneris TaxID=13818 RepID=A0A9D4UPC9_ADICA|nr:hypothetical protein GOP47_0013762 [Adiantum capillus-veneris]
MVLGPWGLFICLCNRQQLSKAAIVSLPKEEKSNGTGPLGGYQNLPNASDLYQKTGSLNLVLSVGVITVVVLQDRFLSSMERSAGAAPDPEAWREVYRDLNQVSDRMRLDQLEFSEVMVIHRMHIKMSELDLGHLEGAEKVERLYVFADVVECDVPPYNSISGDLVIRLPGSVSVTFMCRVWHINYGVAQQVTVGQTFHVTKSLLLQLGHMRWHFNATTGSMHCLDPKTLQDGPEPCFCVYAEVVRVSFYPDVAFQESNSSPLLRFLHLDFGSDQLLVTGQTANPVWAIRGSLNYFMTPDNDGLLNEVSSQPSGTIFILNMPDNLDLQLFASLSVNSGSTLTRDADSIVPAFSVLREKAVELLTDPNILPAMQTSMLIGELVEVGQPSEATIEVVRKHVEWLNNLLLQVIEAKQGQDVEDYVELSFRAQYVIKKVGRSTHRLVVPQLQYDAYSNLINRMAQVAESYDQALRQFRLFIQQNKVLGGFLLEQNRAFAEKEQDMDVFYSELITQRQIELDNTLQKMKHLGSQMDTQRADMEQAQADMEAGLRKFQNEQVARGLFAVIGAIAAVGLTLLTGGAAAPLAVSAARRAVTLAGAVAQGLQRVLDILEGLQVVMEVVELINELFSSLQDLGQAVELPEMPEMPMESDWLIFVNEVEAVAEQMPTEVSEVAAWKTKCKNVAVLGREMTTLAAYISQLQYDIKMQEMLQRIARNQADRLSAIQLPDLKNYAELVTQMDMRTTRLLVALIKVVYIQNAALMYQYLSEPTPVYAWPVNVDSVWRMLVQHEQFAVQGLMRLGPAFDIVRTYVVKSIPVSLLLEGDDYEFEIPVEDPITFPLSLSRVRIHHLEMKFVQELGPGAHAVHMPITDTGSIYMLLQGSRSFHDRNDSAIIHYEAATSLDYHFAYRLDTGETTVTNLPSAEFLKTFMRMTPFTNWRLRLSASAEENKGLAFPTATSTDATTQIAITFFISAIRQISL